MLFPTDTKIDRTPCRVRLRPDMTLGLRFDHRVIDGEQGSRLLRDLGRILSDPASSLALA